MTRVSHYANFPNVALSNVIVAAVESSQKMQTLDFASYAVAALHAQWHTWLRVGAVCARLPHACLSWGQLLLKPLGSGTSGAAASNRSPLAPAALHVMVVLSLWGNLWVCKGLLVPLFRPLLEWGDADFSAACLAVILRVRHYRVAFSHLKRKKDSYWQLNFSEPVK